MSSNVTFLLDCLRQLLQLVIEIKNFKLAEMDEQSVEVCFTVVHVNGWRTTDTWPRSVTIV